jgi:hypothetical protein
MSNRKQFRSRHRRKTKYRSGSASGGSTGSIRPSASGSVVYGEPVDKDKSEAYWRKYHKLAEQDTRLIVQMGIAGALLDWVDASHLERVEDLPRETARFLIDRFMKKGEIITGLNITSYPYTSFDNPDRIGITKIVEKGTRLHLPQETAESPLPDILSFENLSVIHGIANQRPLEVEPPVFTYPDNFMYHAA